MKRLFSILTILLTAHTLGSCGTEFVDAIQNYDLEVPLAERVNAPIRVLPRLLEMTVQDPSAGLIPFWIGYLLPVTAVVGAFLIWKSSRRPSQVRGFDVQPK